MNTAQCVDQGSGYRSVHYKTLIKITASAPIRSNIRTMNYDFTNPLKLKINNASLVKTPTGTTCKGVLQLDVNYVLHGVSSWHSGQSIEMVFLRPVFESQWRYMFSH